jgi:Tol biopolymer transport system component
MLPYVQVMDAEDDTTEAVPDFIDGQHDYVQNDVPAWACNAGGWVVDSADRDDPLDVRVLSDGEAVALTTANLQADLQGVCGEDGACGYEVDLWGLITPYEEHQINVQAYDPEVEQWLDLNGTPRPLTCRTYDIYLYDRLTGETRALTTLADSHEYNPRWSPSGMQIVHDRWTTDFENLGIHITDVATGSSVPLAGAEHGSYPAWSPNGQWIAFDQGSEGDYRVFIVPPAGGAPSLLREDAFMPTWAPYSQRLAFNQPSDGSIRTANLNGGDETLVVERGNGPAWSPNGQWIAYEVDGDLWKIRVGIHGDPLGEPVQLTNRAGYEGRPSWSVDSQTIVFHAGPEGNTDLWTIPAEGGEMTWLTGAPDFGDYDANFSNNGRYIAYASFSPDGQAARNWAGVFTHDLPAGFWSEGAHTYRYRYDFEPGESDELTFNVSKDAQWYEGLVLLRPRFQWARTGEECATIDAVRPDQQTQFNFGWATDDAMTYPEALAFFESLKPTAVWDEGLSVGLERREIAPFYQEEWPQNVCSYTFPKLVPSQQFLLAQTDLFLPMLVDTNP